jgi:hypothetical protein
MFMDHLPKAQELRERSLACEASASKAANLEVKKCYQLLATHYAALADIEERYAAASQSPGVPQKRPQF